MVIQRYANGSNEYPVGTGTLNQRFKNVTS